MYERASGQLLLLMVKETKTNSFIMPKILWEDFPDFLSVLQLTNIIHQKTP
jgi:hypothetical protein